MIEKLIYSDGDTILLTCTSCAIDIYKKLLFNGFKFLQSESDIVKELDKCSCDSVVKITKLVAESNNEDLFFIFELEDEEVSDDRYVIIDTCVRPLVDVEILEDDDDDNDDSCEVDNVIYLSDYIKKKNIESFVKSFVDPDEDEFDCDCDECIIVDELLSDDSLDFEDALRSAYRQGRIAALEEIAEEIISKTLM